METISYQKLERAIAGSYVGFRSVTRLEPIGGPDDKIFPPTFGDSVRMPAPAGEAPEDRRRTRYAFEWRRVNGASRLCVVLDSVPSQANRMELALLGGYESGELAFPFVRVDFSDARHDDPALDLSGLCGDGIITTLEAPHRLADALLRDSLLDGKPFRLSEPGRQFTEALPSNATAVFNLCPASLLFGVWDSTGPKGGLGAKFQRAIVSEIIGVGAELGIKSASRIDPAGIEKTSIYEASDAEENWTVDVDQAKKINKEPVLLKRKGKKAGTPAVINHGNVKPSLTSEAGGVTIDYAEQISVLSLPALRRLRFRRGIDKVAFEGTARRRAEIAAQTVLAALGLAAIAYQRENGYDLRSRCALRPLGPLALELLPGDGGEAEPLALDRKSASSLLADAAAAAKDAGLPWRTTPIDLKPAPKLVNLIRKSREITIVEGDDT